MSTENRKLAFSAGKLWITLGAIVCVSLLLVLVSTDGFFETDEPDTLGAPAQMRLLSLSQYLHIIEDTFGADVAAGAKVRFAPVKRTDGLVAVGAATAVVTSGSLEPLEYSARQIAMTITDEAHRHFLVPCKPSQLNARDDKCTARYLSRLGRLLYRRALTTEELEGLVAVAGQAVGGAGDFYYGLASAVSGMLIAPQFLYIQEQLEPDPDARGAWRLDGYSKASRLSFFLWNSAPDELLLDAAESGALHTRHGLDEQVHRMLVSRRVEASVRAFFEDMLVLEDFDTLAKDPVIYPAFTLKVASDAREQSLRMIVDHLLTRDGDYRDLFTTRNTFLSRGLGMIYELPVPGDSDGWSVHELSASSGRAGLLLQVGFLAQYSHAGRSSPTKRGRGLRETLLCQKVPEPPGNVDIATFEDTSASTARERLAVHSTDPTCGGCHRLTDMIGIGLENFDGTGRFRLTENGETINAESELDGVQFASAVGLAQAVSGNPALVPCFVDRLYSYGVGRRIERNEFAWIDHLEEQFAQGGYRLRGLLSDIATSEAFYRVRPDGSRAELLAATEL